MGRVGTRVLVYCAGGGAGRRCVGDGKGSKRVEQQVNRCARMKNEWMKGGGMAGKGERIFFSKKP